MNSITFTYKDKNDHNTIGQGWANSDPLAICSPPQRFR